MPSILKGSSTQEPSSRRTRMALIEGREDDLRDLARNRQIDLQADD
jgi:hypothetical protein